MIIISEEKFPSIKFRGDWFTLKEVDAFKFIDECVTRKVLILGVEALVELKNFTIPLPLILDLSMSNSKIDNYEDAGETTKEFISTNSDEMISWDFTIDQDNLIKITK